MRKGPESRLSNIDCATQNFRDKCRRIRSSGPGNMKSTETLGGILSTGNHKAHPHRDTLLPNKAIPTPVKPHLLIEPLPRRL